MRIAAAALLVFVLGVGPGISKYAGHPPANSSLNHAVAKDAPEKPKLLASLFAKLRLS